MIKAKREKNILIKYKNFLKFVVDFVFDKFRLKQFALKILHQVVSQIIDMNH